MSSMTKKQIKELRDLAIEYVQNPRNDSGEDKIIKGLIDGLNFALGEYCRSEEGLRMYSKMYARAKEAHIKMRSPEQMLEDGGPATSKE